MYPPLDLRKGSPDSDPGESKSYNSDMHYSTIYPPLILKQIRNDITTLGKLQNERLQTEKKLKTGVDYNDFSFKYDSTTLSKKPSFKRQATPTPFTTIPFEYYEKQMKKFNKVLGYDTDDINPTTVVTFPENSSHIAKNIKKKLITNVDYHEEDDFTKLENQEAKITRSVLLFHKGKIIMLELEDQSKSPLERALDDLIERHLSSRANTRKSLVTNVKASIFDPSSLGEYLNKFSSLAMDDTLAEEVANTAAANRIIEDKKTHFKSIEIDNGEIEIHTEKTNYWIRENFAPMQHISDELNKKIHSFDSRTWETRHNQGLYKVDENVSSDKDIFFSYLDALLSCIMVSKA